MDIVGDDSELRPGHLLNLYRRSCPASRVLVGFEPVCQVDNDCCTVSADREPVEVSCRFAGRVRAVRLILRIVLRTLKSVVLRQPFYRRMFVRTCEGERENLVLKSNENRLAGAINIDAVACRQGKAPFGGATVCHQLDNRQPCKRKEETSSHA